MDIFIYNDYRNYMKDRLSAEPKGGLKRMAETLRVSSSFFSQVLKSKGSLSLDQAMEIAHYWKLNPGETEYFLLLVQLDRATQKRLRNFFQQKLDEIKNISLESEKGRELTEEQRGIYYSNWYFSAARLSSFLPGGVTAVQLSARLGLPLDRANQVLDFLVKVGLCHRKGGAIFPATMRTWIDSESPLFSRHLSNWRLRAIENLPRMKSDEFHYTSAVAISLKDADKIRELFVELVNHFHPIVSASSAQDLYCCNLDWFKV